MRKIGFLLTLFLLFNNAVSYAQTEISNITGFPSGRKLYYNSTMKNVYGETNNLPRFFCEWAEWSKLISRGAADSEYNKIFSKYFLKYYGETDTMFQDDMDCEYIALPDRIEVIKFNCNIHPDALKSIETRSHNGISVLFETVLPESISYFTPKLEADKPIVYLISEATEIIDAFIEEPIHGKDYDLITKEDWEEFRKRSGMIEKYVPAIPAHWGDDWYYSSYPLVGTIYIGNDGYYVNISDADYWGFQLFITLEGEEIKVYDWIQ